MVDSIFKLKHQRLFNEQDLEAIKEGAVRLLEQVGIEVVHPELVKRAQQKGFHLEDNRIRLPRSIVNAFLERTRAGAAGNPTHMPDEVVPVKLSLIVTPYSQNLCEMESEQIVPLTCARLMEAAKLVDGLADQGVHNSIPGCPTDVPAPLQPLMQYRIGIENLRFWRGPVDSKSLESLPYIMDMAEVMGEPIHSLPVYVFSPLRLAGESLAAVMQYEDKLDNIRVGSMPSASGTAPIRPVETFALAAAEVIGSAIILQECMRPKVEWGVSAFSFDLRGMAMSLGSPEGFLFELASCEVNAFLKNEPCRLWANDIFTLTKQPDSQAATEKTSIMHLGSLLGAGAFIGAGALALDDIFSPIQLLIDLEIKDHVERLSNGLDTNYDLEALVRDTGEAIGRGFSVLDRTLDSHRGYYWYPRLFERRFLAPWLSAGCPTLKNKAKQMAHNLIAKHDYEPAPEIRREMERIYQRAQKELAIP